jgi:hypothetical protein
MVKSRSEQSEESVPSASEILRYAQDDAVVSYRFNVAEFATNATVWQVAARTKP